MKTYDQVGYIDLDQDVLKASSEDQDEGRLQDKGILNISEQPFPN